ncbi:MAG: DNA polymerase/3'-5' exonuclease PolX [Planctomycetota bacterium]|nr:DNA polymerase/3'-5' exonuclease PolX [Planctomycetota bacterium]
MSSNPELAARFHEAAAIMEITGANAFRINAITRVAGIIDDLPAPLTAAEGDPKELAKLDGIGKSSAEKIAEFIATGTITEFDELRAAIPEGLIDVLGLPGLGPKTVKTLWEKGGVTDIETLEAKIESGELESLPRMGRKTLANIKDAIDFSRRSSGRIRLGQALPLAEAIVGRLSNASGVTKIAFAGSLRRGRETIGDIDVLVAARDPEAPTEALTSLPGVEKVLLSGQTKTSVRLDLGIQVDLRVVPEEQFGAALLYFTGSKEHNVVLREIAISRSMRLNEYGLFPDDGEAEPPQKRGITPLAAETEQDIYEALGLRLLPPELREDRHPGDWTNLEDLVTLESIKAELHAHTTASDGVMSLEELIEQARKRGFHTLAVTDHSKSSVQANGLSVDRLLRQIDEIREANERFDDITVLAGSEVDIMADGSLDYEDDLLAQLDWVVASPHASLRQDPETATRRLLAAIEHPLVHVIGHPTGRIINERAGLNPDMRALCSAAHAHRTGLELNANPARLDLRDAHVRLAMECSTLVPIDTDAHHPGDFELLRYGICTARRGGLTRAACPNCWDHDPLHEWIRSKREPGGS